MHSSSSVQPPLNDSPSHTSEYRRETHPFYTVKVSALSLDGTIDHDLVRSLCTIVIFMASRSIVIVIVDGEKTYLPLGRLMDS